ncbi:MAG TPA: polysaccharide deacetylase family protein [Actinoplanes sp.]|nr:polysaccharide deacetylase family protein [Actinoplanes sp.]
MRERRRRALRHAAALLAGAATATVTALLVAGCTADRGAAPPAGTSDAAASTAMSASTPPATPDPTTTAAAPAAPSTGGRTGAPGPPPVPAALAGQDLERLPTSRPVVALTFDAGANGDGLASVLATLRREGVPATFFLTGDFARRFPARCAEIAAAGHRLGNHSVDHPHFTALSDQAIRDQVAGAEQAIRAGAGRDPRPLFRFPYGDRDQRTIRAVNAAGYVAVRWTVDSLGWKGTSGGMSAAAVTTRVLGALRPGEIVLMHVGSNPDDHTTLDADALPSVIARIRAAGYGFVTLDALF